MLALAALCIAALGGWTVYREAGALAFEPGTSDLARVVRSLGSEGSAGLSTFAQFEVLQSCQTALTARQSLEMRFLPAETQDALAPHCLRTARAATAAFPTDAYAWSVGALAAAREQDWAGMNAALVRSQVTGPTEQWVAELRVTVAQDNYARLDEAARFANDQDLLMLLKSIPGIRAIAQRYIDDLEFRARIVALVETTPPETQRRFVSVVEREMS